MGKKGRVRVVGVNERGWRIGEHHHRSKLTDQDVELIRQLRDGDPAFWTYEVLAEKFDLSKSHIRDIVLMRKRAQFVTRFIEVCLNPKR